MDQLIDGAQQIAPYSYPLGTLKRAGITLRLDNGLLHAGPSEALTLDVRRLIRDHREQIVLTLSFYPNLMDDLCDDSVKLEELLA